ncbi:uroporphyrinogen-III synthase [Limnohabitans sp. 15K]|uniref:uroporphyrinogen-III synthase n=1 Tax=Limnohabitans sp. 15K TaxID=1100706 RepID=UPI000C1E7AD0|nr:uroporphyrinogen-III synthase [Limnohabitans sp. 15K]PIT82759.1 hydroxymethylbilane hydrolyase [Limnohabitans sp. 15K]
MSSGAVPGRVIVTRPEREAKAWADALQARGVHCEILPLIDITALPEPSVLAQAWQAVSHHLAVMFVSANAVRFFMDARPAGLSLGNCRAWSTGPGTHAALLAAGWPADSIDSPPKDAAQFDSEALWNLVAGRVKDGVALALAHSKAQPSVLIVRGADTQGQLAGRDWLALQLENAGLQVLQTVAYVRQAPALTPMQRSLASEAVQDGSWWLFSSSEAAQHLWQVCPDLPIGQARALATHPRIAQRLLAAGWGRVEIVPTSLESQAESIKSLT